MLIVHRGFYIFFARCPIMGKNEIKIGFIKNSYIAALLKGLPSDGGRGGGLNPISRKRYGSRYTMEAPTDTQIIDRLRYADGDAVRKGDIILRVHANYRALLLAERLSLNILQRMSGIATATAAFVKELEGTRTRLLDTRKTAPGLRVLDKMAVRHGGGMNHRMGLYDMVMLKDNHIKIAGGIPAAVAAVKRDLPLSVRLEVETTNLEEVKQALECGADIIMFDNMDTATMAEAVKIVGGKTKTEASGNMSIPRLKEVAATGVDYISVGALTHSVTALDISMNITQD